MTAQSDINRRWSASRPVWAGVLTIALLVGGFGGWAVRSEITGAIIAFGRIEVDQNRLVVQHIDGGVVSEILVKEGDTVTEGQMLVRLDAESLLSELAVTEGQFFEVLARRARFEAERDNSEVLVFEPLLLSSTNPIIPGLIEGQERLLEARLESEAQEKEQLARRRDQIGNQIDGIDAQKVALDTQMALITQELVSQQSLLDRGLAQASGVLALQRQQASLLGQSGELIASRAESEGRQTELDIEILRIDTTRREEANTRLRDLQFNEIELSEKRRALITRLERLDIRAPVSGIVYGMAVFTPRSVIRAAEPVLYLVPQDRPLVIATQVQPNNIDSVFVGQAVSVRFSAFDQRVTPELFGQVTQVSADAFTDQGSQVSYYRAEIQLNDGEMDRLPANLTLIPGMPVEAFISTDSRSPMAYLLKPLSDYFTKAFRES